MRFKEKHRRTAIEIILVFIFFLVAMDQCVKKKEMKEMGMKWQTNYENEVFEREKILRIGVDIARARSKTIDSLYRELELRDKELLTVDRVIYKTNYKYKEIHDTIIIIEPYEYSTSFDWAYDKDCFHLEGRVLDSIIILNSIENTDEITTMYYRKRPHKFLFVRWGRWQYKLKQTSYCGEDSMRVEKIIIEKER